MPVLVRFGTIETDVGPMSVAWTDVGLAAITGSGTPALLEGLARRFALLEPVPAPVPAPTAQWLRAGFRGGVAKGQAVDLRGISPFDRRVYEEVRRIPAGATATYGDVAAAVGSPRAARAVGSAMSRCPLFPAVPCHRVVRADGIGGWGGSVELKRRLIEAERTGRARRGVSSRDSSG